MGVGNYPTSEDSLGDYWTYEIEYYVGSLDGVSEDDYTAIEPGGEIPVEDGLTTHVFVYNKYDVPEYFGDVMFHKYFEFVDETETPTSVIINWGEADVAIDSDDDWTELVEDMGVGNYPTSEDSLGDYWTYEIEYYVGSLDGVSEDDYTAIEPGGEIPVEDGLTTHVFVYNKYDVPEYFGDVMFHKYFEFVDETETPTSVIINWGEADVAIDSDDEWTELVEDMGVGNYPTSEDSLGDYWTYEIEYYVGSLDGVSEDDYTAIEPGGEIPVEDGLTTHVFVYNKYDVPEYFGDVMFHKYFEFVDETETPTSVIINWGEADVAIDSDDDWTELVEDMGVGNYPTSEDSLGDYWTYEIEYYVGSLDGVSEDDYTAIEPGGEIPVEDGLTTHVFVYNKYDVPEYFGDVMFHKYFEFVDETETPTSVNINWGEADVAIDSDDEWTELVEDMGVGNYPTSEDSLGDYWTYEIEYYVGSLDGVSEDDYTAIEPGGEIPVEDGLTTHVFVYNKYDVPEYFGDVMFHKYFEFVDETETPTSVIINWGEADVAIDSDDEWTELVEDMGVGNYPTSEDSLGDYWTYEIEYYVGSLDGVSEDDYTAIEPGGEIPVEDGLTTHVFVYNKYDVPEYFGDVMFHKYFEFVDETETPTSVIINWGEADVAIDSDDDWTELVEDMGVGNYPTSEDSLGDYWTYEIEYYVGSLDGVSEDDYTAIEPGGEMPVEDGLTTHVFVYNKYDEPEYFGDVMFHKYFEFVDETETPTSVNINWGEADVAIDSDDDWTELVEDMGVGNYPTSEDSLGDYWTYEIEYYVGSLDGVSEDDYTAIEPGGEMPVEDGLTTHVFVYNKYDEPEYFGDVMFHKYFEFVDETETPTSVNINWGEADVAIDSDDEWTELVEDMGVGNYPTSEDSLGDYWTYEIEYYVGSLDGVSEDDYTAIEPGGEIPVEDGLTTHVFVYNKYDEPEYFGDVMFHKYFEFVDETETPTSVNINWGEADVAIDSDDEWTELVEDMGVGNYPTSEDSLGDYWTYEIEYYVGSLDGVSEDDYTAIEPGGEIPVEDGLTTHVFVYNKYDVPEYFGDVMFHKYFEFVDETETPTSVNINWGEADVAIDSDDEWTELVEDMGVG